MYISWASFRDDNADCKSLDDLEHYLKGEFEMTIQKQLEPQSLGLTLVSFIIV